MKTLVNIDQTLMAFEKKFGLPLRNAQQQSPAWFQGRLGVITASNASKAVAGAKTDTRFGYLCGLIADVCTGVIEEVSFKQTDWGNQHEDAARSAREFATGEKITPLGFVFKDESFRTGCSPDGISLKPEEIKCPFDSANYVKFLLDSKQKPEWVWQNQMTLWVLEADGMFVTQFDPRMKSKPLHTIEIEANPASQKQLDETIPQLIEDMDGALKEIGIEFGDHWLRIAAAQKESA